MFRGSLIINEGYDIGCYKDTITGPLRFCGLVVRALAVQDLGQGLLILACMTPGFGSSMGFWAVVGFGFRVLLLSPKLFRIAWLSPQSNLVYASSPARKCF